MSTSYDYSTAAPMREFDLIPAGTIASMQIEVRPGGAGDGGWLKRSKSGECEMLDLQFVLLDGPYAKRKFWGNFIVEGTTAGQLQAVDISRSTIRAIIESARGVRPDDMSPEARQKRVAEFGDLNGMAFLGKVGVEKGSLKQDGSGERYSDKNTLVAAITPDRKDWHHVEQPPAPPVPPRNGGGAAASTTGNGSPAPAAPAIGRPNWAE